MNFLTKKKCTYWEVVQCNNQLVLPNIFKRVMKLTGILLLITFLQVSANGFSQSVTLATVNSNLENVFIEIRKQTGFDFLYNNRLLKHTTKVTLNVRNLPLNETLTEIFKDQPLDYSIYENTIILKRKEKVHFIEALSERKIENGKIIMQPLVFQSTIGFETINGKLQKRIIGRVTDGNGEALIGVSISLKGTGIGTSTGENGAFSINIPTDGILEFSYLGFIPQEIATVNRNQINVSLEPDNSSLDDVVVTALGIARDRKALGYSVTELKGETLTQAREINVANSLVGKVAGLNVNSVSGGPGSSVNIQIRGMSSISQSNQPLYVVNGIPMTNETSSGTGQYQNAPDRGDNIGNINPDDIESISVLKGAAASALYGSRAKAGVILITTKSGKAGAPASVEFNSNYVVNQVVDPTNFQYEYGQGSTALVDGQIVKNKPISAAQAYSTGSSSWGPKIDNEPYIQADGVMRPYSAARDNFKNFYRLGGTWTNTLSFSKGFDQGSVRFSVSNLGNTNIMPNSGLDRQTFNFTSNFNLTKRLNLDVRANYILEDGKNRTRLGDNSGNATYGLFSLANTVNINNFKNSTDEDGNEINISGSAYTTNPWFAAEFFKHNTKRNRLISSATLRYNFDSGYFIQARAARDFYNDRYTMVVPTGTAYRVVGQMEEQTANNFEINADILAGKTFELSPNISLSPNIGASYRNLKGENINAGGTGFSVPFVYYLGNVPNRTVSYGQREEEMQAVYGTLELNYRNILYLTGTGRTDWFSTLATPDNSNPVDKFYPSISGSFVFSEYTTGINWLSFGKLRAGYAEVGQATSPYQTALTYGLSAVTLNGLPIGNISGSTVPNKALMPSLASELEIGTEMRLFDNRLSLDFTWYRKTSTNEIVNAPASPTSGFTSAALNIGKIRNTGFEGLVTLTPFRNPQGFTWSTSFNGTINKNEILALATGDAPLTWATARSGIAYVQHRVGEPAAQVVAYDYARDANGNIELHPLTGLPLPSNVLTSQGSAYHKWLAGWINEFSYKRLNFGFLIDGKFGGKIYSNTESTSTSNGKNKLTLVGRDDIWGINRTAQQYYSNLTNISALFVKDASFIKFRQVSLGYTFPNNMFNNRLKSLNVSFVGRNLFTLMKKTDNIDPEAAYSGQAIGLEMGVLPPQRTYGINLSARF